MKAHPLAIVAAAILVLAITALTESPAVIPVGGCSPFDEKILLTAFKGDMLRIGVRMALAAGLLYMGFLRLQVLFPRKDRFRVLAAAASAAVVGVARVALDVARGSECLSQALGSGSSVSDRIASTKSLAGTVVPNLWIAALIDFFIYALVAVAVVRLGRELFLRAAVKPARS